VIAHNYSAAPVCGVGLAVRLSDGTNVFVPWRRARVLQFIADLDALSEAGRRHPMETTVADGVVAGIVLRLGVVRA
jgi:hypothetical protein